MRKKSNLTGQVVGDRHFHYEDDQKKDEFSSGVSTVHEQLEDSYNVGTVDQKKTDNNK
ncbi:YozQ family protein [Salipaludibacillus agaradhaerens]|uniref:YozQ family protein n=1 Tax=Salipaludibacillus agaradhaerens TaxID=76935 RepID=A0A9Q4B1E4_SALAG|nr:YozQ family protein [Salipaludibacillus agaradhaerens]MCR6096401.1 YozQ family protein [Salipaludibacillus agaradhaerens]MCR6114040.1 YozQ family protein [Salipaludibacillus agaradhaerens]